MADENETPDRDLELRKRGAEALRTSKTFEHREFAVGGCELRGTDDQGMLHFTGYASVTETPYPVGRFTETIKRGAFKRTLNSQPDVVFLINHGGLPLARSARPGVEGTLTLQEDHRGLLVDAVFDPADRMAQDLALRMRNKLVDQMSFAFRTIEDEWNADWTQRAVRAAELNGGDVSAVTFGANAVSTGSMRSAEALLKLGGADLIAALVEWRDFTLLTREERAGRVFSAGNMEVLTNVLGLISQADDAVDAAQPLLAQLMGVPNPDADDESGEPDEPPKRSAAKPSPLIVPDYTKRARLMLASIGGQR